MATEEQMELFRQSFERKVVSFNINTPYRADFLKDYPKIKLLSAPAVHFFQMCDERFGDNWIWSSTMLNDETTVFFKDPNDVLIFRLMVDYKST